MGNTIRGMKNIPLNPQNYWVFGLLPSSGILGTRKHDVSETGSVSALRCGGKTPTQLGPLDLTTKNPVILNVIHHRQNPLEYTTQYPDLAQPATLLWSELVAVYDTAICKARRL
jgi:hypothetical protein